MRLLAITALLYVLLASGASAQEEINRYPRWARFTPENSGLADLRVLDILEAPDGSMWFVHPDAVSRFDARAWQTFPITVTLPEDISVATRTPSLPPWSEYGLSPRLVRRAVTDSRGALWLATDAGAFRLDPDRWENGIPAFRGMALYQVRDVLRDSYGVLWFAGYDPVSGEGSLSGLDPSGRWLFFNAEVEPLASNQVVALAEDAEGGLWAGTVSSGVSRYLGSEWQTWTTANSPLPDNRVIDVQPTEGGRAMVTVTRGGAARYRIDADAWETHAGDEAAAYQTVTRWQPLTQESTQWAIDDQTLVFRPSDGGAWGKAPLPLQDAVHVAVDPGANLWIQTADGVVRYDPDTGAAALFNAQNSGLAESQAHLAHIDRDGLLVFGTDRVYVSTYRPNPPARPGLALTVDGRTPMPVLGGAPIVLSSTAQDIAFEVSTAAWWPPGALAYHATLEGPVGPDLERTLNTQHAGDVAEHRASATFTDLEPGEYRFCAYVTDPMLDASPTACAKVVIP